MLIELVAPGGGTVMASEDVLQALLANGFTRPAPPTQTPIDKATAKPRTTRRTTKAKE